MDCKFGLMLVVSCVLGVAYAGGHRNKAICIVEKSTGMASASIAGTVVFEQTHDHVEIKVNLYGFNGSVGDKHGFHVHTTGNMSSGCMATGGHYNPKGKTHGAPGDETRHVGDLGNIVVERGGVVMTTFEDKVIRLDGPYSIVGRALVIHAGEDDLGKGGKPGSMTTGNAGGRMGCCLITKDIPEDAFPPIYASGVRNDAGWGLLMMLMTSSLLAFFGRL